MAELQLGNVLTALDGKDADAFVGFLTEDATFRYGSQSPVKGRAAIRDYVSAFLGGVHGLSHRVTDKWQHEQTLICQGEATYSKLDGSEVTVPFVNVMGLQKDKIRDYRVYVDPTPLLSPR